MKHSSLHAQHEVLTVAYDNLVKDAERIVGIGKASMTEERTHQLRSMAVEVDLLADRLTESAGVIGRSIKRFNDRCRADGAPHLII